MKLYLNIDNRWESPEMDRNENELQLNYNFASLESPADYIGEFAMDFKIPRTQNNDLLFSQYFRVDSVVTQNNGYNPAIKIPYRILDDNGEIISEGSGYINNITKTDYIFALQGAMFSIFSKALNSGWNTTAANEDEEYFLMPEYLNYDGTDYTTPPTLTAALIQANWNNSKPVFSFENLKNIYNNVQPDYRKNRYVGNIINWIPTHQGAMDGIDTTNWLAHINNNPNNETKLCPIWTYQTNGNNSNFPLEDKPTEYQMAEFRSYNQQPAIYIMRLWQWYTEQFENITGYQLELDESFFNQNNNYYSRLVYTLPKVNESYALFTDQAPFYDSQTVYGNFPPYTERDSPDTIPTLNNVHTTAVFYFPQDYRGGNFTINFMPHLKCVSPYGTEIKWNWYYQCLVVKATIKNSQGVDVYEKKFGLALCEKNPFIRNSQWVKNWLQQNTDEWFEYYYTIDRSTATDYNMQYVDAPSWGTGIDLNFSALLNNGDYLVITTQFHSLTNILPFCDGWVWTLPNNEYYPAGIRYFYDVNNLPQLQTDIKVTCNNTMFNIYSGQPLTLEKLFGNEKPFEVLLKYSKYLNLIWLIDEKTKTVKVQPRQQYFYDCLSDNSTLTATGNPNIPINGILDLTPKVNYAKEIKVLPIDWSDKEIYLNFDESDADFLKTYNETYKRTYGSKVLQTPNKRTKSRKEFFDKLKVTEAADVTPYFISIGSCLTGVVRAYQADRLLLNSNDDNKKTANLHGQFVFRNYNSTWNPKMFADFRNAVIISDDSNFEITEQKRYYHGSTLATDLEETTRPVYSPVDTISNACFWFAFPRLNYSPVNYADNTTTIYDRWKNYLYEIFNINNKTIEVYINLDSTTYKRLKINPLCQIDNCVYIMMQMAGYNENTEWVKCTLKQFGSVENLTAGAVERDFTDVWLFDNSTDTAVLFDDGKKIIRYDNGGVIPSVVPNDAILVDTTVYPVIPATPIPYDQTTINIS